MEVKRDALLPGLQNDRAEMLSPGTVLWDEAGPMLGVADDLGAALSAALMCGHDIRGHDGTNSLGAFSHDSGVGVAHDDAELEDGPRSSRNRSVAEILAEEVGVCAFVDARRMGTGTPGRARRPRHHLPG